MSKKKNKSSLCELGGYLMTEKQFALLLDLLEKDILNRYHYEEYWNRDLIDGFAKEYDLKESKIGYKRKTNDAT